jgi:hypothetical protein
MKGTVILMSMLFCGFIGMAQEQPQEVKSIVKEIHEYEWYTNQYSLWEKEIKKDNKNGNAWINLYSAARMSRISAGDKEIRSNWYDKELEVVNNMSRSIKGTFAYYRIMGWYHSIWRAKDKAEEDKIISYVEKAHELNPNEADIYPNLMNIYEIARPDLSKQKEISILWKASADFTPKLMALSYNVLMNTKQDAIIITGGDNDTYPLWIIQHADDFRKDVNVLNISLLPIEEYRNRLFKKVGIPALEGESHKPSEILEHIIKYRGGHALYFYNKGIAAKDSTIFDKLYNVGVIYQYSEESFNNTSLIVDHFENKFIVDQLKYDYYQSEYPLIDKQWDYSYLPGLVSLYQHYKLIGNELKAEETKKIILFLGKDFYGLDEIKEEIGFE